MEWDWFFYHWTWLPILRKQFAKVREEFFNSGKQVVIRLITPLRMSYEESYAKAFPFDKMVPGMLDPEMIEDTEKIVNEARKDKAQVNLIINTRAGGNAPCSPRRYWTGSIRRSSRGYFESCSMTSRMEIFGSE